MDVSHLNARRLRKAACASVLAAGAGCTDTPPMFVPPGADETVETRVLEAGAAVLQTQAPLGGMNMYLVGFHPMKAMPDHQIEAHHFCRQVNEDFAQCALFDGNTANANLNGIEYIISERLFDALPEQEKQYWHPHNYEILSGQLIAPGIPERIERELMEGKMNSYGKTWHVWNTGALGIAPDEMPLGEPMLGWSFNRDGEALPGLAEERDERMSVDTAETRRNRSDLVELANPQSGVDALNGQFPRETRAIEGVIEKSPPTQ